MDRRAFLASASASALALLFARQAPGLGRSLPPIPTADEIFGWAREVVEITRKHSQFRRSGSPGDAEVRRYIAEKLRSFGLDDAVPLDGSIRGKIAVMDVVPGEISPRQLAAISDYVHDPDGVFADAPAFPAPNLSSNFPVAFYTAHEHGAAGLIGILDFPTGTSEFYPDVGLAVRDLMPALFVGKFDGERLVRQLNAAGGSLEARIRLLGRTDDRAVSGNVVASLPGQTEGTIIVNTHHDGCFASAVEDASGVASVLALAKFYAAYPSAVRSAAMPRGPQSMRQRGELCRPAAGADARSSKRREDASEMETSRVAGPTRRTPSTSGPASPVISSSTSPSRASV